MPSKCSIKCHNQKIKESSDVDEIQESTLKHELLPIITTSTALSLGLLVTIFSGFLPNNYFGYLKLKYKKFGF